MADDKKISEMTEVTAGNLEDNMQMELFDPNEVATEDQNKRIRFDTLEGIFGAEDKIFEGDSSVEVVDTGTGEIIITVDAGEVGHYNASGLRLGGAGARVNDIETALTDDDTHLPTSGAVIDALAGLAPDKIFEGDSSVEVIDTGTGEVVVTVDGNPIFDVKAAGLKFGFGSATVNLIETVITDDDTRFPTSGAVVDALAADVKDIISEGDTSVEAIDIAGGQVLVTVDGNPIFDVLAAGLAFATGARVDTIETTLTDDDTHLPTSGAVVDAIAAISIPDADKIVEGNSSIEVIDAGTGQLDFEIDGIKFDIKQSGNDFTFDHKANGGRFVFTGLQTDTTPGTLLDLDPDIGMIAYSAGFEAFRAFVTGIRIYQVGSATDFIRMGINGANWDIASEKHGAKFQFLAEDGGGVLRTLMILDPAGSQEIYHGTNGFKAAETEAAGFKVFGTTGLRLDDSAGGEAIGNAATTVAITFGAAKPDAGYHVICTVENTTDGSPLVLSAIITAKATTGFTATLSATTDSANYILNWTIVRS